MRKKKEKDPQNLCWTQLNIISHRLLFSLCIWKEGAESLNTSESPKSGWILECAPPAPAQDWDLSKGGRATHYGMSVKIQHCSICSASLGFKELCTFTSEFRIWSLFYPGVEVRDRNRHGAPWLIWELIFSMKLKWWGCKGERVIINKRTHCSLG